MRTRRSLVPLSSVYVWGAADALQGSFKLKQGTKWLVQIATTVHPMHCSGYILENSSVCVR
jgi:hypothetical protein